MHTYIHTYLHTYTHACMHAYIHTYLHTYHTYIHIHTHIQTYIHTYTHTYIHTYEQTYIHTYVHTYIHTYTCTHAFLTLKHRDTPSWESFRLESVEIKSFSRDEDSLMMLHILLSLCFPSLVQVQTCLPDSPISYTSSQTCQEPVRSWGIYTLLK